MLPNSLTPRAAVASATAALVFGGAIWASIAAPGLGKHTAESTAPSSGPGRSAPGLAAPFGQVAGVALKYAFQQKTTVRSAGKEIVGLQLDGELEFIPLAKPSRVVRVAFSGRLVNLLTQQAQPPPDPAGPNAIRDDLERDFKTPFLIAYGDGAVHRSVHVNSHATEFVAQVWRSLATTLDFSDEGRADVWRTVEEGVLGRCDCEYRRTAPDRTAKSKLSCVPGKAAKGAGINYDTIQSTQDFQFAPDGHVLALKSSERVVTERSGPIPSFASETELTLRLTGREAHQERLAEYSQGASELEASTPKSVSDDLEGARIGNRSVRSALAQLVQLEGVEDTRALTDDERRELGHARIALKALLRRDAQHIASIVEHIRKGGPLTDSLIGVLGEAGSPDAQSALSALLKEDTLSGPHRLSSALALSRVDAPTPETVAALRQLEGDPELGKQATYGLGSNAFRLREQNPNLANTIVADLEKNLNDEKGVGARHRVLTALGNAGNPSTLTIIERYLTDPSETVRAAAAQALRRIPGLVADDLLARASQDPLADVRYSAHDAISEREPSPVLLAAVARGITKEPSFRVRSRSVQTAGRWITEAVELVAPLRKAAQSDESEHIRRTAGEILAQNGHAT